MNVLLTGATGFIGGHLRTRLTQRHEVCALVRERGKFKDEGNSTWTQADLSDSTGELVLPGRIDAIVCLAQSKAYRDFPEKAWEVFSVNVSSVMRLLEYARQHGVKIFVLASTANVYRPCHELISESHSPDPTSFYGRSKRIAEMLVESYAAYFRCVALRLFTVYGPGQAGTLIPSLIERVRNDEPIQLPGGSGLRLTPVYVADVCRIIQAAIETEDASPGFEVFNVGGDEELSIHQIGSIIGDVLGASPRFEIVTGDQQGGWMADNSKLKEQFRDLNLTPFLEGISRTLD